MAIGEVLEARLRAGLGHEQEQWFTRACALARRDSATELQQVYTEASRRLGNTPLAVVDTHSATAAGALPGWTAEDAGRLVFLLAHHAALGDAERFSADALACYEQGDTREQRSWLRAVGFLPDPKRYLPVVIDACRTNILPLFEAVACENEYPARFFPERNFNQLVLKALFNNVALARIEGLAERGNPELARMASDYAAERRAAGRSVPADIGLATGLTAERT